jgi:hypothetical protein
VATYRLPFDQTAGTWSVGKGNFDDPGNHHGSGQPFSWDFLPPTQAPSYAVRAARAGTVIHVDNTVCCPTSSGGGSFVYLRHEDNTSAAYYHMTQNSIVVSKYDYVEQGTMLGIVGNTGHTDGTYHVHFSVFRYMLPDDPTPTWGTPLPVHFEDANNAYFRPLVGQSVSPFAVQARQDGWYLCRNCAGLYFAYQTAGSAAGVCPANGGPHETLSNDYNVSTDPSAPGQPSWSWCSKCSVMFFGGSGATPAGSCPASFAGSHDGTSSGNYHLIQNTPGDPGQHHWRWCSQCYALWFGDLGYSRCPVSPAGHWLVGSGDYSIAMGLAETQSGWALCARCGGLYFAPNGAGVCAQGGGGHGAAQSKYSATHSDIYTLSVMSPVNSTGTQQAGWQGHWAHCKNCELLFYTGRTGSRCPANGGAHDGTGSGTYYLYTAGTPGDSGLGQAGWTWCTKCQGLWYSVMYASGSVCAAGGAHSTSNSLPYQLLFDTPTVGTLADA